MRRDDLGSDGATAEAPAPLAGKRLVYAADGDERGGDAMVQTLVRLGAAVLAVAASKASLGRLVQRVEATPGAGVLSTMVCDLADPEAAARVAEQVAATGAQLHAVIVNLGGAHVGPSLADAERQHWDAVSWSLRANAVLAKTMLPLLQATAGSLYLLLNDSAALDPKPASGITAASAAGQLMLARTLAFETQGAPIVHSLIVMAAAGVGAVEDGDYLTPANVGAAVTELLRHPRAARNEVILCPKWRERLGQDNGDGSTSFL